MTVLPLAIPDVKLITPKKFGDHRGFFSEVYKREAFEKAGLPTDWFQDNQSLSRETGVLRGLHFQLPPFAQTKLVRVIKGAIFDVAVDIRRDSPTFGQHVYAELSADNFQQLLVPAGFAHGFLTLTPDTEVLYKVNAPYSAPHDRGILWNDPALKIPWPLNGLSPVLSDKDTKHPTLATASDLF